MTLVGSALGVAAGVGYAWLMLAGLTHLVAQRDQHAVSAAVRTPQSLVIGFVGGLLVSLATMLLDPGRLGTISVRTVARGANDGRSLRRRGRGSRRAIVDCRGALAAVAHRLSALSAPWLRGEAQAGAFVGSGALVLAAALTVHLAIGCDKVATSSLAGSGAWPIARLAARNGARNPSRSTLSIGLIAAASFLIVALSAFRLDPTAVGAGPDSGSGGFTLVAQSDQPIYQNLNTPEGRVGVGLVGRGRRTAGPLRDRFAARARRRRRQLPESCTSRWSRACWRPATR